MDITREIIASNFGTWLLIICLLFILIGNKFRDKYINFLFYCFVGCVLVLNIADIVDFYCKSLDYLSAWRYISSMVGYLFPTLITITIGFILLRREKKNKFTWLLWIPFAIDFILIVTTPFTHVVYYFSDLNAFYRGPLAFMPLILSGCYLVLILILSFVYSRRFDKVELITICLIGAACFASALIEWLADYKFLLCSALAISCFVYYLYFYVRQTRIDVLTGLYNRQCFFAHIDALKPEDIVIISIDLNGLKDLNDAYGHAKGDEALSTLAKCLISTDEKKFQAYRIGGDEFTVVGFDKTAEDATRYITKVKEKLAKTPYMAAFGFAFYNKGQSFDDCIKESDAEMYKDKNKYKHR